MEGTQKNYNKSFDAPKLGTSTTIVAGFGNQTPSGTGLRDQGTTRIGHVLAPAIPEEGHYHPHTGTAPSISGRKLYFR